MRNPDRATYEIKQLKPLDEKDRIRNPAALFCGFWLVDGGFAEELFAVV
jgi:hypothetical protein